MLFGVVDDVFKGIQAFVVVLADEQAIGVAAAGHSRQVQRIRPVPAFIHAAQQLQQQGIHMMIEHGIAVGITVQQFIHGNGSGSSGHVRHDDRLSKDLRQGLGDGTNSRVGITAGACRDQNFNGLLGIIGQCGGAAEHHHDNQQERKNFGMLHVTTLLF